MFALDFGNQNKMFTFQVIMDEWMELKCVMHLNVDGSIWQL
jgi:hypothetical protein